MIEATQKETPHGPLCHQRKNHQRSRQGRRVAGGRAMGSQAETGRPNRRYSVALPTRGAKRTRRKTVPDLKGKGKSRAVPVLRTIPRRGRVQGAPGERAFQDLHRRPGAAAAGKARTCAIRVAVEPATATGPTIWAPSRLEPRKIRKCELAAMDMDAAEFGAAVQGRKHFSGIEQALRVEGAFQPLLLVEIDLRKHLRHQIAFLDADAVFAGQY